MCVLDDLVLLRLSVNAWSSTYIYTSCLCYHFIIIIQSTWFYIMRWVHKFLHEKRVEISLAWCSVQPVDANINCYYTGNSLSKISESIQISIQSMWKKDKKNPTQQPQHLTFLCVDSEQRNSMASLRKEQHIIDSN